MDDNAWKDFEHRSFSWTDPDRSYIEIHATSLYWLVIPTVLATRNHPQVGLIEKSSTAKQITVDAPVNFPTKNSPILEVSLIPQRLAAGAFRAAVQHVLLVVQNKVTSLQTQQGISA